jgi:hypothetical protein
MTRVNPSKLNLVYRVASLWNEKLSVGQWVFITEGPVPSRGRWQVAEVGDDVTLERGGDKARLYWDTATNLWMIEQQNSAGGVVTLKTAGMARVAGEVRFIKDQSETKGWAYGGAPPSERDGIGTFKYTAKKAKTLARILRGTMLAMGHTMSVYSMFAKLKSSEISPDGSLGGKGYIQKIKDMRFAYGNVIEALSGLSDTLYDEVKAPHWTPILRNQAQDAQSIIEDAERIQKDPEGFAEQEVADEFKDPGVKSEDA